MFMSDRPTDYGNLVDGKTYGGGMKWNASGQNWVSPAKPKPAAPAPAAPAPAPAAPAYNPYADMIAAWERMEAQRIAAAQEAERKRREAAQQAYDTGMASVGNAYAGQVQGINDNYDSSLRQMRADNQRGVEGVNKNADSAQQQAYLNMMMGKRDLPQQLAAMGISGGAAETTQAGLQNNYGNARNEIELGRADDLTGLAHGLAQATERALQSKNSALTDAQTRKAGYELELAQNLANGIAAAANQRYDREFQIGDDYLKNMAALTQAQAKAANAAAAKTYKASNKHGGASLEQGVPDWSSSVAYKRAHDLMNKGASADDVLGLLTNADYGYSDEEIAQIYNQLLSPKY